MQTIPAMTRRLMVMRPSNMFTPYKLWQWRTVPQPSLSAGTPWPADRTVAEIGQTSRLRRKTGHIGREIANNPEAHRRTVADPPD
jgi:hypothetical protein